LKFDLFSAIPRAGRSVCGTASHHPIRANGPAPCDCDESVRRRVARVSRLTAPHSPRFAIRNSPRIDGECESF
jgi:hypothetical protein